jgi:phospholipid/cholesterol/gamma-HCH transport system ATP-binding protein
MGHTDEAPAIDVRGLCTRLGGRWIHRDLDMQLHRGEVLALIGGSGGGKTVLMHHLIGLLKPVAGSIRVFDSPIHHLSPADIRRRGRRWGVLFQQGALFSALSVFDNVAFPLREMKRDREVVDEDSLRELVFLKLQMVGLEPDDAWKFPAQLSGGMVKRAALARALALDAELLFLDEPTAGLDPILAAEFDSLLLELRKELRLSVLLITHDLNSLASLSDQVAVLSEGRLLTTGTLEEVARYDHPFVRQFFRQRQGEARLRALQPH